MDHFPSQTRLAKGGTGGLRHLRGDELRGLEDPAKSKKVHAPATGETWLIMVNNGFCNGLCWLMMVRNG